MKQYPSIEIIERVRQALSTTATEQELVARTGDSAEEVREAIEFLADDGIVLQIRGGRWGLL
jgi:DNA-binding GntR family transcriptional regulator